MFSAFPLSDLELAEQARILLERPSSLDIPLVKGTYVSLSEPFIEGLAMCFFSAFKEDKWSAETVGDFMNQQFFDLLGIPKLTSESAAKKKGHDRPLIYNRDGCHRWQPELSPETDLHYGYIWQGFQDDAVALLGSEEAVRVYVEGTECIQLDSTSTKPAPYQEELFDE
ncbi:MAG TPA: hypothetical protein PLC40_11875 [Candidatus Hydrogenedentes bacterium]|nr:hypothetical protein [Candidatus Hydrogenedentota bacterium]